MRPTLIAVRTLVSVTCCSVTLSTPKHATARLVVARNSGGPGSQFSRYINWAAICSRAVSKRNISSTSAVAMVDPVVVPALAKQTSTVIMLHGLGDVGSSYATAYSRICFCLLGGSACVSTYIRLTLALIGIDFHTKRHDLNYFCMQLGAY
jgi:hypothetical protein